ncbi:16051_t:CDS:2, partial [Cetraspora pellucida]
QTAIEQLLTITKPSQQAANKWSLVTTKFHSKQQASNSKQTLSTEDFNKQWALVNNFWTKYNSYILDNGNEHKTFVCRLSKPQESTRIRITWLAALNIVRIERVSGTSDHSHSIEESDMRKWLKFIKDMVDNEAIKDYKPPTIANKLVGPMNSHFVGDANLKPDILNTIKFLIENNYQVEENSKAVTSVLKIVRKFAPQWNPQYMLLDQSSVKSNGVVLTFPGLSANRNKINFPTLNKMIHTMHKKTQAECEKIVCDVINTCSIQANAKYIAKNYLKNLRQWSLWARQHSPLLLQITSTNPLESYHSELKAKISV